jgi:superfamily II DNA helicase RecQ
MICIDEVHCASEWSHNFRPSYLKLNDIIQDKLEDQKPLILGLTATATKVC